MIWQNQTRTLLSTSNQLLQLASADIPHCVVNLQIPVVVFIPSSSVL